MTAINNLKRVRRERLAMLLDEIGQTELAEKTGYAAAYLYQMGKGAGKSVRSISDTTAKRIEDKIGLPSGWMDTHDAGGLGAATARASGTMAVVKKLGGSGRGSRANAVKLGLAPVSQPMRIDVPTLRSATKTLVGLFDLDEREFDPVENADLIAHFYAVAADDGGQISGQNVLVLADFLKRRWAS